MVSLRLARTAPWQAMVESNSLRARWMTVLASCCASSANTLRASSTASPCTKDAGTARTARVLGEKGVISSPKVCSVAACASAVATSCGVAAKVAGISRGWLDRGVAESSKAASIWVLSRS